MSSVYDDLYKRIKQEAETLEPVQEQEVKLKRKPGRPRKELDTHQYRENIRKANKKYLEANPLRALYQHTKSVCKTRNIPFDLELSDLVMPEFCPYLGWRLTTETGKGHVATNISISRVFPSMGYVKGNVEIISRQATMMKAGTSPDDQVKFAEETLRRYKKT